MAYLVTSSRSAADRTLVATTGNRQQPVCDVIPLKKLQQMTTRN